MPDYKKMYFQLFNKVTDVIEILQQAQIDAEEEYIRSSEEEDTKRKAKKVTNEKE